MAPFLAERRTSELSSSGDRADHIVVWATLDRDLGRAAIKSFVVPKGTPGMRVDRLEQDIGRKHRWNTTRHTFQIYGVCEDCRDHDGQLARRR